MTLEVIQNKFLEEANLTQEEIQFFLNHMVYLIKQEFPSKTYHNMCDTIQTVIANYLAKLNITYYACDTTDTIDPKVVGHSFVIADFTKNNQGLYLIDPTIIQFYYLTWEYKELYINDIKVISKSPYEYLKEDQIKTKELLEKGYIEFDNSTIEWYANSFFKTRVGVFRDDTHISIPGHIYLKSFIKYQKKISNLEQDKKRIN